LLSAPSYIITRRSLSSFLFRVRVMVFNATFNNNSVISWQFYYWRKLGNLEKTTDLSQVTEFFLSHNVVSSTHRLSEFQTHNVSGDRHQ
jgi:hypothetical protein